MKIKILKRIKNRRKIEAKERHRQKKKSSSGEGRAQAQCSYNILHLLIAVDVSSRPIENLHTITDCVCSNDVVTYVVERFATVWEGSTFDCASQEITLPNSNFGTPQAVGVCNNRRIVV